MLTSSTHRILAIIGLSFVIKAAYLVFAVCISDATTDVFHFSAEGYGRVIYRNDVGWYASITAYGYPLVNQKEDLGYSINGVIKQSEWAFFPLYPMLVGSTMRLFSVTFTQSGIIWSLILSTAAFLGFYHFCRLYWKDPHLAAYATAVLMLWPFHYYFSVLYTEALFFTLLIFSFCSIRIGQYGWLIPLLAFLTLTRPNGLFLLLPVYLYFLESRQILRPTSFDWKALWKKDTLVISTFFLSGVLAFGAYGVYQQQMTGYFWAFSIAQAGWERQAMWPWLAFFRSGDFTTQFNSVYTLLIMLFTILNRRQFSWSFHCLIWITLFLPLCSGAVTSLQRFVSIAFPLTMAISQIFYQLSIRYWMLLFLLAGQLWAFYYWLISHTFSF
jgi:Gpi18-like mannosyltransferase